MNQSTRIGPKLTPFVRSLIIALASIWLFCLLTINWFSWEWVADLYRHFLLHPGSEDPSSVWTGEFWQLVTYMFLHDLSSPFHVFINGLMLWFFAPVFEQRWGAKPLSSFLLYCGIGAAGFTVLASAVAPSYFGAPVLGASGAILGLISAFGLIFPRQPIYLWFLIRIEGRFIIPLTIGIDTLLFLSQPGSFAYATHMGGLLTGYLLITGNWRPSVIKDKIRLAKLKKRRSHLSVVDNKDHWIN